jgi:DNA-binding beta-propeller fold protein YncE
MKKIITLLLLSPLFGLAQKTNYKIEKEYSIKSAGGWDYLITNQDKLYVSHGTQVNVLDKNTGDSLGVILNTTGVHGIAFEPSNTIGFTSNGRLNNVFAFNTHTNEVVATIATGGNPDAIFYEPFTKTIITCNGSGKSLSFINAKTYELIATTEVGGKPETAVSDEAGNVYVNIEDKNEIIKVNAITHKIEQHWKLDPLEEPTGLAIDLTTKRLFAGGDKLLAVVNMENGKIVTTIPIGEGCDGVAFDNKNKLLFTSNGSGTMSVIKEINANHFETLQTLSTSRGARTIAIDNASGTVYIPTAKFEPQAPGAKERPKMIPGSFTILKIK